MTERIGPALLKAIRAMADVLESELREEELTSGLLPSASNDAEGNTPGTPRPDESKRQGARPVYRPQGPIDELSVKRANDALKVRGLLPRDKK